MSEVWHVATCLDKLMTDVGSNLEPKNRLDTLFICFVNALVTCGCNGDVCAVIGRLEGVGQYCTSQHAWTS
jgi:hypothetical protein